MVRKQKSGLIVQSSDVRLALFLMVKPRIMVLILKKLLLSLTQLTSSIAVIDKKIFRMVKRNAFLNGDLVLEVYIKPLPWCYESP